MEKLPQSQALETYRDRYIDLLSIAVELCVITSEEAIEKYRHKRVDYPDWPELQSP